MYYYVSEGNIIPSLPSAFCCTLCQFLAQKTGDLEMRVGYSHWTGLLDSPKTAKYTLFNTEQKLNILLIHSVTSLALDFPEVKGHMHI